MQNRTKRSIASKQAPKYKLNAANAVVDSVTADAVDLGELLGEHRGRDVTGRSLSAEERVHARRALLFLAERSAPARLAEALGLTVVALQKARAPSRVVGRRLAARVASVAGVDLADVLSGAWPGDLCPRCGRWGGASLVAPPSASTTADEAPLGRADRSPAELAAGGAP